MGMYLSQQDRYCGECRIAHRLGRPVCVCVGVVLRRLSGQGTYIGSVLWGLGEGVMVSRACWLLGGGQWLRGGKKTSGHSHLLTVESVFV